MSNQEYKYGIYNAKWTCDKVMPPRDDNTKFANPLKPLYKELTKILGTHEDVYLPEGGLGKVRMIQSVLFRINHYRINRGWPSIGLEDLIKAGKV